MEATILEETMFRQLNRVRGKTIHLAQQITEEQSSKVLTGFSNSIIWHLGHIYIYGERFGFLLTNHESQMELTGHYEKLFSNGTNPSDWTLSPPSLGDLLTQLKGQVGRTQTALSGKLSSKTDKTVLGIENPTIAEILLCWMIHEKEHAGFISAIIKVTTSQMR